jgi:oligopeptide/dipeptide ABC transporter ATP-binding protein
MELLRLEKLVKQYPVHRNWFGKPEYVPAVCGVSLSVAAGESVGIVGESGCGKSTLAQMVAMLEVPTTGEIYFDGVEITCLLKGKQRKLRRDIQIVFQDTYASLNPRFTVSETLTEPLRNFVLPDQPDAGPRIRDALAAVEISADMLTRYPYELSGGQRQRVCIARALILRPRLIIFDEATSGLDVTLQQQILQLLGNLRQQLGLTYIFITHNLQVLPLITNRVGVMYLGKVVEVIDTDALYKACHPYTRALLAALPVRHPRERKRSRELLGGEPPQPMNPPQGCRFHPRCSLCSAICRELEPTTIATGGNGVVACHSYKNT